MDLKSATCDNPFYTQSYVVEDSKDVEALHVDGVDASVGDEVTVWGVREDFFYLGYRDGKGY